MTQQDCTKDCQDFNGGEVKHAPECRHYNGSLSQRIDICNKVLGWIAASHTPGSKTLPTNGAMAIAFERGEQLAKHGFQIYQDAERYPDDSMVDLAVLILMNEGGEEATNLREYLENDNHGPRIDTNFLNHVLAKSYKERLVIAGALLATEYDKQCYLEQHPRTANN